MEKLDVLKDRLSKLGIEVEFVANFPWIYLYKINGEIVKERFLADHGFTVAFLPVDINKPFHFTDIGETFELIREYIQN